MSPNSVAHQPDLSAMIYKILPSTSSEESLIPVLTLSNSIFNIDTTVPEHQRTPHSRLGDWYHRLTINNDGVIIYAALSQAMKSCENVQVAETNDCTVKEGAEADEEAVGFLFAFPRVQTGSDSSDSATTLSSAPIPAPSARPPPDPGLSSKSPLVSASTSASSISITIRDTNTNTTNPTTSLPTSMTMHIWLVGVDPAHRSRKIFLRLLTRVFEHARERGYEKVSVCTYPMRFEKMYAILKREGWREGQRWDDGKVYFDMNVQDG